jgi:transcriptional regulator GlxA family with amidase domain
LIWTKKVYLRHGVNVYRVNIIANENALFSTIFGPFDILLQAGVFWNAIMGKPADPYFELSISSIDGLEIKGMAGVRIQPHCAFKDDDEYDLVIVPSEGMNISPQSDSFNKRVAYIKRMHNKGAVIASVCTGAFLVAATGLLDNKTATTHWALAKQFRQYFPLVELNTDLMIVEDANLITAGGVSADQDLSLHLITRFCGQEVALQSARCTLVDMSARQQAPFKSFVLEKKHGDPKVLVCQQYIENNLHKNLSIDLLAEHINMGKRTLNRRFKIATGESVIHYIQQLKVEKAKFILERNSSSFDDIANTLGYENVSFFRRLFKQWVGVTPKEYRRLFVMNG